MTPRENQYRKSGESIVKALERRHFTAQYCATAQEAKQAVLDLIAEHETVGWGGSQTLGQIGVIEALRQRGQKVFDRADAADRAEAEAIAHRALGGDVFLMSSNAVTEDGCLVNLDGNGNRVAALIYGPKRVIVVAGMNKVTPDVDSGILRTRRLAAPTNAQRFGGKTPCAVTGQCGDCVSPDCICANLVVTRLSRPAGRVHVILVGEDLGM